MVDFDAGTREYPVTIRVSDGTNTLDVDGTFSITGVNEHTPAFASGKKLLGNL